MLFYEYSIQVISSMYELICIENYFRNSLKTMVSYKYPNIFHIGLFLQDAIFLPLDFVVVNIT